MQNKQERHQFFFSNVSFITNFLTSRFSQTLPVFDFVRIRLIDENIFLFYEMLPL